MPTKLPKASFLALAAIGWADGRMRKEEAAGLVRAAEACGCVGDELGEVRRAGESKVDLASLDLGALSPWEAALTYAVASWLAALDGIVSSEELAGLRSLRSLLPIEEKKLQSARSAAYDVAALPGGERPDRFDFAALETRLKEKLPATFRASMPPEG